MKDETYTIEHAALEITNLCNLECIHCYASSSPREKISRYMTKDDWFKTIEELAAYGCNSIQFIGGEPTVHPDLASFIRHARNKRIDRVQVYTNGISISENLMNVFIENKVDLAFSIYSHKSATHDVITTTHGSQKRTERNIRKALESGLNVAVGIIAMDSEDQLEIERTIHYVRSLGVDENEIGVDRVRKFGRGERPSHFHDKYSELCGRCWSDRIAINDKGDISPCVMSKFVKLGHISEGLSSAIHSLNMQHFQANKPKHFSDNGNFLSSSCKPGTNCRCPTPPQNHPKKLKLNAMSIASVT